MKGNDIVFIIGIVGICLLALVSGAGKGGIGGGNFFFNTTNNTSQGPLTEAQIGQEIRRVEGEVREVATDIKTLEENKNASVYKGLVSMHINGAGSENSLNEQVVLTFSSQIKKPIDITGWKLRSLSTKREISIGKGVYLYFPQTEHVKENILAEPNDLIYISTGRSPLGLSFQVNLCSGYHNQFLSFNPSLRQECPLARNEKNNIPPSPVNDSCFDFIDNFPQCGTQVNALPPNFGFECRTFLLDTLNYSSCISLHKDDAGFYKKEWRVFLERSEPLWKSRRETVELLDNEGKIVASTKFN